MIDGPQSSNVQMSVAHAMHCVLARLGLGGGHAVQPVLPTLQLWPLMPPTTAASGPTVNVRIVSLPRLSFLIFFIAVPPCGPSRRAARRVPAAEPIARARGAIAGASWAAMCSNLPAIVRWQRSRIATACPPWSARGPLGWYRCGTAETAPAAPRQAQPCPIAALQVLV